MSLLYFVSPSKTTSSQLVPPPISHQLKQLELIPGARQTLQGYPRRVEWGKEESIREKNRINYWLIVNARCHHVWCNFDKRGPNPVISIMSFSNWRKIHLGAEQERVSGPKLGRSWMSWVHLSVGDYIKHLSIHSLYCYYLCFTMLSDFVDAIKDERRRMRGAERKQLLQGMEPRHVVEYEEIALVD